MYINRERKRVKELEKKELEKVKGRITWECLEGGKKRKC